MATIKVKFRSSSVEGCEGTVVYQIIHERKVRQLFTDIRVFPDEWDKKRSASVCGASSERVLLIACARERMEHYERRLSNIIKNLENRGFRYDADEVVSEFEKYLSDCSLSNFMTSIIARLRQNGKLRTAEAYRSALNSLMKFRNGRDRMLDECTGEVMESYQAYLRERGIIPNTVSFYMRILRATYNRAAEAKLIKQDNPFRHVYTGIDKTVKRALPLRMIRRIKEADLQRYPSADYARDMFLMSFYLRGMSFVDMAFLKKSDLEYGHVIYCRRKTGQRLTIAWTKEMQSVLDKYPVNSTQYLLPIITEKNVSEWEQYRKIGHNINSGLKKVANAAGVPSRLTMYVARHSWASAAKVNGVPIGIISEGLGHDSEATTQIYLASFETSLIDKANEKILKSI